MLKKVCSLNKNTFNLIYLISASIKSQSLFGLNADSYKIVCKTSSLHRKIIMPRVALDLDPPRHPLPPTEVRYLRK